MLSKLVKLTPCFNIYKTYDENVYILDNEVQNSSSIIKLLKIYF